MDAEEVKTPLEAEKERGTALFKAGDYAGAVAAYGLALAAVGEGAAPSAATLSAVYGNRAAALVMLKRFEEAGEDCDRALAQDPGAAKLLMRKSKCALACGDAEGALAALGAVLEADPTNAAARVERTAAQKVASRIGEAREAAAAEPPRPERVVEATEALMAACPASVPLKMLRAAALLQLRRLPDALALTTELCQQLSGGGPALGAALLLRAQVLNQQVRYGMGLGGGGWGG